MPIYLLMDQCKCQKGISMTVSTLVKIVLKNGLRGLRCFYLSCGNFCTTHCLKVGLTGLMAGLTGLGCLHLSYGNCCNMQSGPNWMKKLLVGAKLPNLCVELVSGAGCIYQMSLQGILKGASRDLLISTTPDRNCGICISSWTPYHP